jgi:hypothetical protein
MPASAPPPPSSDIAHRFFLELRRVTAGSLAGQELLPERLMAALAAVLPVDGAGLSVLSSIRMPLGSSSEHAARAERLQSTLGDGPCLTAYAQSEMLMAREDQVRERWPLYYSELIEQSPFRSVASIPLFTGPRRLGAMDLYWSTPHVPDEDTVLDTASTLAPVIVTLLMTSPQSTGTRFEAPVQTRAHARGWVEAPPVRARMQVWVAIGMLRANRRMDSSDALSTLRAAAYSRGISIDELSEQLINRDISTAQILG